MFVHYHAKTINAERVGARLVRVVCTRCGCEYFYQFTRIGSGSAQAPYGLGVPRATAKANEKAQKDLQRRMASESELVPCPKCNWINEDLVAGFRRGSYRKMSESAGALAVVGAIFGVILGLVFATGAAKGIAWILLLPAGLLSLAGGVLLLRYWLRSRIQPNQDHPLPPKLPVGSPPALVKDPESGQLLPAKREAPPLEVSQDWCDFQIGRHTWPLLCSDCLQSGTLDCGHTLNVGTTLRLTIPRCSGCQDSTRRRYRHLCWNGIIAGVFATAAIVLPLNLDWLEFSLITAVLLAASTVIAILVARRMTAPAKIAGGDKSRGVVRLRFRNADYARTVAERLGA
jgi:hypothetical protein